MPEESKHTPGPWFAVEYAGYWNLQTEPFYTDEGDLLDEEHTAAASDNAKLAASAPALLADIRKLATVAEMLSPDTLSGLYHGVTFFTDEEIKLIEEARQIAKKYLL